MPIMGGGRREPMYSGSDGDVGMKKNYKGKSMRLGGGGRFKKGEDALVKKGMPKKEAGAIMAKQGRAKYGKAKMASMAAAGKARVAE